MSGRIHTFADLPAPVRLETFFEQDWESERLKRSPSDPVSVMIADLQRTTDYDALLDGLCRRVRSARAGKHTNFRADVRAVDPRSNERNS